MLTMIMGLPNAGKTTYSKQFNNVVHQDEERRTDKVCEKVSQMSECVVEGIFASSVQRRRVLDAYQGDYTKCIFLDISLDTSIKREDRGRKPFILENCAKHFSRPTYDEGWDEIIIIEENNVESISHKIKT